MGKKICLISFILGVIFCVCMAVWCSGRVSDLEALCQAHIAVEKDNAQTEQRLRETIARFEEADEARVQELQVLADQLRYEKKQLSREEIAELIETTTFRYHAEVEDVENTCIE